VALLGRAVPGKKASGPRRTPASMGAVAVASRSARFSGIFSFSRRSGLITARIPSALLPSAASGQPPPRVAAGTGWTPSIRMSENAGAGPRACRGAARGQTPSRWGSFGPGMRMIAVRRLSARWFAVAGELV